MRKTHGIIEHEWDALGEVQEQAQAIIDSSRKHKQTAMIGHASIERFQNWFSYYRPVNPKWKPEEIWGEDPQAVKFRRVGDELVEENEDAGTFAIRIPRPRA